MSELEEAEFDPFKEAEGHFLPQKGATEYRPTPWQSLKNHENLCEFRYGEVIGEVAGFKRRLLEEFKKSEAELRKQKPSAKEINAADTDRVLLAVKRTEDRFLGGRLDNTDILSASITDCGEGGFRARVTFTADAPEESSLLFGPGRFETCRYAMPAAGSLKKRRGAWSMEFEFRSRPLEKDGAGVYEYILGGRNKDGSSFAAMCLMDTDDKGNAGIRK